MQDESHAQIRAQMQLYFDGLYTGDVVLLSQVFDPDARYVCATGDQVINLGMAEYFPIVAAREAPAKRGEARLDEIVSTTLAGPKTALVVARCSIGPRHFTDFLSFIRTGRGWRIIAKVFHHNPVPEEATTART